MNLARYIYGIIIKWLSVTVELNLS